MALIKQCRHYRSPFQNNELDQVVFIGEPKATMYPVSKLAAEDRRLRNFHWLDSKRPKTKAELFGN